MKIDDEVQREARIMTQDIVNNNCFVYELPTYGTLFQMLKSYSYNYTGIGVVNSLKYVKVHA